MEKKNSGRPSPRRNPFKLVPLPARIEQPVPQITKDGHTFGRAPYMLKRLFILSSLALFAFSCKKNLSPVGVDILPDSDQLNGAHYEMIPKVTYTLADDSLLTGNVTNSNILGSVNDPVFGRFDASIYINFETQLSNIGPQLGTNPVLDSVVLMMYYNTAATIAYIGDTTHPLSLDIYELNQKMYRDSAYYSARKIGYDGSKSLIEGGSRTFTPQLHTKIRVNKDDAALNPYPQLRVRLRKDFGERLFNTNYLTSLSAFQNIFYGLYITTSKSILPQPGYGSAFYVNMLSSRILLYYHNDNTPDPRTLAPLEIYCGANSVRFGHFDHDYQFLAHPNLSQQLKPYFDTLSAPAAQNIFLQGGAGIRAKLEFPELINWRDSNIVLNKAELSFTVDKSNGDFYNPSLYPLPLKLFLLGIDRTTGKQIGLIENVYTFGGTYDAVNNRYFFNIPHTVAQTMTNKIQVTDFYVTLFQSAIFPHRVVLGGSANGAYPVKLRLWYTRLSFPKK